MNWTIEKSSDGATYAIPTLNPKQSQTAPFGLDGITFDLTKQSPIEITVDFRAGEMLDYKIGQELFKVGVAVWPDNKGLIRQSRPISPHLSERQSELDAHR
jgi:hypothetical protein